MFTRIQTKTPADAIDEAADLGKSRKTYFSFGDEGTTATVGASGRLLRISRHFPGSRTGFCVDDPGMPAPYRVDDRLKALLDMANNPSGKEGIGLSLDLLHNGQEFHTETSIINDRWPTFQRTTQNGFEFQLQYVAFQGTIFQKIELIGDSSGNEASDCESSPVLSIRSDVLIRNLDFVDNENTFNDESADDVFYRDEMRGDKCIVREHQDGTTKTILCIHLLDQEDSQEKHGSLSFVQSEEEHVWRIERRTTSSRSGSDIVPRSGITEFVLAYTLEHVPVPEDDVVASTPTKVLETMKSLLKPRPQSHSFTKSESSLNFFLRRNLEHILSVCCVPVPMAGDEESPAIAFTCGDVDGHRVATAASFYASQILLQALNDLNSSHAKPPATCTDCDKPTPHRPYVCETRKRIERALEGHMMWLSFKTKVSGDLFCPHSWVNGENIAGWEDNQWLAPKALTDVPFQIIKVAEICKSAQDLGRFPELKESLKQATMAWIQDLGRVNKLGKYAFPRYDDAEYYHLRTIRQLSKIYPEIFREDQYYGETTQDFYLTDHALIWLAINAVESLEMARVLQDSNGILYSSTHMQPRVLKRFTTETPFSQRRMIAVTRSPTHNRFFFRSKDAVLFRAMEQGFFDRPGLNHDDSTTDFRHVVDVWENTIECQANHDDNDDINWDDPRRFALSIIMAYYNKPINLRSPEDMRKHAICVLLESSSANGLFPGKLSTDGDRYGPAFYDNELQRDNYWGATFEIPFVLWKYGFGSELNSGASNEPTSSTSDTKGEIFIASKLVSLSDSVDQIYTRLMDPSGKHQASTGPQFAPGRSMKHSLPLNNTVDSHNVVEMQDEWLYKTPAFFQRGENNDDTNRPRSPGQRGVVVQQLPQQQQAQDDNRSQEVNEVQDVKEGKDAGKLEEKDQQRFFAFMKDVPKSQPLKKGDDGGHITLNKMTSKSIEQKMAGGRTVEHAKKRFWAFFSACPSNNSACLDTVSNAEKREKMELKTFLQRHQGQDKFFMEETAAAFNLWTTELHLSCFNIVAKIKEAGLMQSTSSRMKAPILPGVGKGGRRQPLTRVVMSFRFEGDFFDRYWTCRYLEANEGQKRSTPGHLKENARKGSRIGNFCRQFLTGFIFHDQEESQDPGDGHFLVDELYEPAQKYNLENLLRGGDMGNSRIKPWQQRRVLELLLFRGMVGEIIQGARQILEEVHSRLGDRHETKNGVQHTSATLGKRLGLTRKQVEEIQVVLQTVEEDLDENIAEIDLWQNREIDRQAERPRWTLHDESRYRVIMQKLQNASNREVQTLRTSRTKITNIKEKLAKQLDARRSEDIRRFTYVTLIFLPLGFATGIHSMSEAPKSEVVQGMVFAALGAFLATLLLLYIAKMLDANGFLTTPQFVLDVPLLFKKESWLEWIPRMTDRARRRKDKSEKDESEAEKGET